MKKSLVAVILLLVSGIPAGLAAQSQEPQPSPFKEMVPLNPNDDQRMAVVRKLMRIRNYQAAADMLETIYQTDPSNAVVQNLLRTCYDNLKQYDKAEMLLRRMIEQNPRALGHRLGLAEVLIKQGNRDDGLAAYGVAIDMVPLDDVARQMPLVLSLISSGLTDQALIHIDAIRQATGDSTAFAVQKCQVLESRQEYASAAYEYLPLLLQDTTRDANTAERRLVALLEFSGSAVPVEGVLVGAATDTSGSRIMRLLTDYYVKAGRFDEAFAFALRHDSLTGGSGVPLLSYARQCAERHSWLQAERMGQILQAGYKDAPVYMEALFRLADAQAHLDRYAEAMATYERILAEAKHDQDRADALLGLGMVRFAYTHEYAVALTYFDSVAVHYPRGLAYLNARRSIPYCYLRSGDLTGARREFEKLAQLKLNDDLREEVLYNLARVSLFEKQYDSAEVSLRKLMVDFPRGFYVNDALQLVLLLGQAEGADDLLYDFSNALFFEEQGLTDSTRVRLESIAVAENPALGDLALFRLAELDLKTGDSSAAVTTLERLAASFPDSYYVPFGMKIRADILVTRPDGAEAADALYRELLESYSDYPFTTEVRNKLRELQEARLVG